MEKPNGPSPEAITKAINAIMPGLIRIAKNKKLSTTSGKG